MENYKFIHFNLSAGTYSIDDFNAKLRWKSCNKGLGTTSNKDLKLVIAEDYTFIASNDFFIALGIQDNYPEKTTLIRSRIFLGPYKTSLDTSPHPISLSLHCRQIKKAKNELYGQPSSLLVSMHVMQLFLHSI